MIREDSKQILLSVFGIAILIVAIVGISYAIFVYSAKSSVGNTVTSGGVSIQFLESENAISIVDALPMSDASGMRQSQYFDFTVSSVVAGSTQIFYEIRGKQVKVGDSLDPNFIKIYLEKENNGSYQTVLSPTSFHIDNNSSLSNIDSDTMLLYKGVFKGEKTKTHSYHDSYRLRMWIDSHYPIDGVSRNFKMKVNVYASM